MKMTRLTPMVCHPQTYAICTTVTPANPLPSTAATALDLLANINQNLSAEVNVLPFQR